MDYERYIALGGRLTEPRFAAVLGKVQAAIDNAIWPNEVDEKTRDAYEQAIVACIELADSPPVRSERVGNISADYAEVPTISSTIRTYLGPTGLLRRAL